MNYIKTYYDIINKAKTRGLNKRVLNYYTEKHHILPKCYFKSVKAASYSENLVLLTAREHYICHYLIWKFNKDPKMLLALYRMMNGNKIKYSNLTSKEYEVLKLNYSKHISLKFSGKNNPNFGKKFSEKTKELMSKNHANFSGKNNPMFGINRVGTLAPNFGKKHNDTTKMKMKNYKIGNTYARKRCNIDGVEYASLKLALNHKNISLPTLIFRLKSEKYENYFYI